MRRTEHASTSSGILDPVSPEQLYARLVRDLDGWTAAAVLEPGRLRASVPQPTGGRRTKIVVMTPEEWEVMVTVLHGSFESALDRVKQTLLAMGPEQGFAVHVDHALEPSTSAR